MWRWPNKGKCKYYISLWHLCEEPNQPTVMFSSIFVYFFFSVKAEDVQLSEGAHQGMSYFHVNSNKAAIVLLALCVFESWGFGDALISVSNGRIVQGWVWKPQLLAVTSNKTKLLTDWRGALICTTPLQWFAGQTIRVRSGRSSKWAMFRSFWVPPHLQLLKHILCSLAVLVEHSLTSLCVFWHLYSMPDVDIVKSVSHLSPTLRC